MRPRLRVRRSRYGWAWWAMPVCLMCGLAGALLWPAIPGLALRLVGFVPQGDVEAFWVQRQGSQPAQGQGMATQSSASAEDATRADDQRAAGVDSAADPGPDVTAYRDWFRSASRPQSVVVSLGSRGSLSLSSAETYAEILWFGEGTDGYPLGIIGFREDAVGHICDRWLAGCTADRYRVDRVDFRAGGAVLYGGFSVAGLWQDAGVVLVVNPDGVSLDAAGLVYHGMFYALPAGGDIVNQVRELTSQTNAVLRQATVQANGLTLALAQLHITDDRLTVILR